MSKNRGRLTMAGALLLALSACAVVEVDRSPDSGTPSRQAFKPPRMAPVSFDALPGWSSDDHKAALASLKKTCVALMGGETPWARALYEASGGEGAWNKLCEAALTVSPPSARRFFESAFTPYRMGGGTSAKGKLTAYYTPRVKGARHKRGDYAAPLFAMPANFAQGDGRFTRKAITAGSISEEEALAWVDDPIEAFWMQIQGAGDVELANGESVLMEVAGTNGEPWQSPGGKGLNKPVLQALFLHEPGSAVASLAEFPRYVFYRRSIDGLVRGAAGVPLTAHRSVAVDPRYVPLGSPVFLSTGFGPGSLNQLAIAQDVGGAITGFVRADLYMGRGRDVEKAAMSINHDLDLYLLKARPDADYTALKRTPQGPVKTALSHPPEREPVPTGGGPEHAVQLGAFGSIDSAERAWRQMVDSASPLLNTILPRMSPAGGLYRLRAGPLESRIAADGLCEKLRARRIDCFPVAGM